MTIATYSISKSFSRINHKDNASNSPSIYLLTKEPSILQVSSNYITQNSFAQRESG